MSQQNFQSILAKILYNNTVEALGSEPIVNSSENRDKIQDICSEILTDLSQALSEEE